MRHVVFVVALLASLSTFPAHAFTAFRIQDIRVEGLQRIEVGTVFNYLPVNVGDTLDDARAAAAVRALFKTGFFADVRLQRVGGGRGGAGGGRPAGGGGGRAGGGGGRAGEL